MEKESNLRPLNQRTTIYHDAISSPNLAQELQWDYYWSSYFDNGMQDE